MVRDSFPEQLDALQSALRDYEPVDWPALPGKTNHIHAGVLVPLLSQPPLRTVVTVRTSQLSNHPGEVCFPGGRPEDGESIERTALREAEEELGIESASILARLSSVPLFTSEHRLFPFVALVEPQVFRPSPDEVAKVIEIDLAECLEQPVIEAICWRLQGMEHLSPVFDLDGDIMFGSTAHVLMELLRLVSVVLGRDVPERRHGNYAFDMKQGRPYRSPGAPIVQLD